jgi:gluconate:H+ symporter, GntP family
MPSTFLSYVPIILPITLIVLQSFGNQLLPQGSLRNIIGFVGHPVIALFIGTAIAFFMAPVGSADVRDNWITKSLEKATIILLCTGISGAFGRMIVSTGVGEYLGKILSDFHVPGLLLPFIIAFLLFISQGSSTVSMLTTAALIKPLIPIMGIAPELAVLAIGAGAITGIHANSSFFWVVMKFCEIEMKETYWSVTGVSIVVGVAAFISVSILSLFI